MSYPAEEDELVDGLLSEGVGRIDMDEIIALVEGEWVMEGGGREREGGKEGSRSLLMSSISCASGSTS